MTRHFFQVSSGSGINIDNIFYPGTRTFRYQNPILINNSLFLFWKLIRNYTYYVAKYWTWGHEKIKNMTIPPVRPPAVSFVYLFLLHCLSLASDHVVIVVMDGARYSETMGDKSNVPNIAALARQGTTLTNFRTFLPCSAHTLISETIPGHSGITTGTHQDLSNDGSMLPTSPSIFQYYRKEKRTDSSSCIVLCSKKNLIYSPIHQIHSGPVNIFLLLTVAVME